MGVRYRAQVDRPKTFLWWLIPLVVVGGAVCFVGVPWVIGFLLFDSNEIAKSGSAIGPDEINLIQTKLAINLPPGTAALEFHYTSFLDDSLWAKLKIDPSQITAAEQIVHRMSDPGIMLPHMPPNFHINPGDVILHQRGQWSQFEYGEAIITQENGIYYLYLHYFTT